MTHLSHAGDWRAETPYGAVTAPKVILATNGHLRELRTHGRAADARAYLRLHDPGAHATDEVARLGGQTRWNLTPADPLGTTVAAHFRHAAAIGW